MGDGNAKGFSVNAKTIILILLFLNVGFTIKMIKKYQNTKDAGYVREQTFKDQMEKRVQRAFGSAEELNRIVEDATRQKEEAERVAEALKDQLQKSESQKKQLLNSLKEGVYQCDPGVEGVFTWVNQACAEMFGYKSPEEMIGTKVEDIYVNIEDRRRLGERLEKDGFWRNFVSFCRKKNGVRFYTERTSNMAKDENGKPIRIEGIIRDITERKKLEEELQRNIKKLEKNLEASKKEITTLKNQRKR